jgi:hypothetical protein
MVGVLGIFKARGTKVFNDVIGKASEVGGGSVTSILPIKCLLSVNSDIYGSFLLNMALPVASALLVTLILIPTTLMTRCVERDVERELEKRKARREAAARGESVGDVSPSHEPIVYLRIDPDYGISAPVKILNKVALRLKCCRKVASEEYIANARRASEGERRLAPRARAWLSFDANTMFGLPHALLVACKCCRVDTTASERSAWRAAMAVHEPPAPFYPRRRFVAVMVLVMYSLFPTLVASTTSIFNCSDAIGGKYYLLIDLTVTCYEGYHLVYLSAALLGIVVYCIGTPITLAALLVVDCCTCSNASSLREVHSPKTALYGLKLAKYHCKCICTRRSSTPWGYRTASIRERFGLLVAGYDTGRGSIVMAWEPLFVMQRKLLVTLAGTLLRDPCVTLRSQLFVPPHARCTARSHLARALAITTLLPLSLAYKVHSNHECPAHSHRLAHPPSSRSAVRVNAPQHP